MIDTPRAALPRWLIDDTADLSQARAVERATARKIWARHMPQAVAR